MSRRRDIDWMRGIAVLCMVEHHTFDAFLRPDLHGSPYDHAFRFFGGVAAPTFLFLAGAASVLGLERQVARGTSVAQAARGAVRRGLEILVGAYLFRFQEWALAWGGSPASDLLRIDILNCIGLALCAVALAWAAARTPAGRAVAFGAGMLLFVGAAPFVWAADLSALPRVLADYLHGTAPQALFPLFPWVAHAFAGALLGLLLAHVPRDAEVRAFLWLSAGAVAVWFATRAVDAIPAVHLFPQQGWWETSPAAFLLRTCSSIWILAALFAVDRLLPQFGPDPLLRLGQHSLIVYWVHVEIVYGRWFWRSRGTLSVGQGALAVAALLCCMVGLAWAVEPTKALLRRGLRRDAPGSVLAGAP